MWKKVVIAAVLTISVSTLFAQNGKSSLEGKTPEEIADLKMQGMTKKLALTDAQAESVHQIVLNSEQEKAVIRDKYPQLDEAKKEGDALRKETQAKVRGVLTEEQIQKMKESRKMAQVQREMEDMKSPNWDQKIKQMQSDANLTDEQVGQLKVIFKETDAKRQELLKKYPELTEAKKEMQANKKETEAQIKSVLTEEQIKIWEEKKQQPKGTRHGKRGPKN